MRLMQILRIQPLDPLMIRDGRPFDMTPGIKAYSLHDVSPSVLAGTIRTLLGKYSENTTSIIRITSYNVCYTKLLRITITLLYNRTSNIS